MPRKVILDDAREDIQNTRVWRLLDYWVEEQGGNGLTANAICSLTDQPWKVVRHVLTAHTGKYQICGQYCGEVNAPVFYPTTTYLNENGYNILMRNAKHLLDKSDAIIKKYPPAKYPGASEKKGQKTLTFFRFERSGDEYDEYEDRCDDPLCCPPKLVGKKLAKTLERNNREMVRELKRSWK